MAGRVVLFGATGYTGRLVAEAMVERGMRPVLAARSREKLDALAAELGGELETTVADVSDPPSVSALVERGDVLVTTVGPFARWGTPAGAAATTAGAHYLDSTGESAFIREVFERYGPAAERAGCGMLTAFGYDWVPGNLAGALALREGGDEAVRVDLGYFFTGQARPSGGTQATIVASLGKPGFAFRDGRVTSERAAKRVRSFAVRSKQRDAISVGSSEHFTLPRIAPQLREVNAYLGWFGPLTRPMQALSLGTSLPGAAKLLGFAAEKLVRGSTSGPDAEARSKFSSHIVAIAYDGAGRELAEVHVAGGEAHTFPRRPPARGAGGGG